MKNKAAKNLVALSTHRKIFIDLLNKIAAGGQSRWNIFTDFFHAEQPAVKETVPVEVIDPQRGQMSLF